MLLTVYSNGSSENIFVSEQQQICTIFYLDTVSPSRIAQVLELDSGPGVGVPQKNKNSASVVCKTLIVSHSSDILPQSQLHIYIHDLGCHHL